MYIPKTMTKQIAKTFYDKEVDILEKETNIDSEGGITSKGLTLRDKFNGNVSFSNCKKIQEEFGLDYEIDISITTNKDTDISKDNFIKYRNIVYYVTDILPTDSHILIIGTKWRQ